MVAHISKEKIIKSAIEKIDRGVDIDIIFHNKEFEFFLNKDTKILLENLNKGKTVELENISMSLDAIDFIGWHYD